MSGRGYLSEIFVSFQGEGLYAGDRHLFVRLADCPLRCRYCDTPDSLERVPSYRVVVGDRSQVLPNPVAVDVAAAQIEGVLAAAGPLDGISFTGGEPLAQADFLAALAERLGGTIRRLLETAGVHPGKLRAVLPVIDAVSMDIKLPSNTGERSFWQEHEEFLRLAGRKAYVKILIDCATDSDDLQRAVDLVAQVDPDLPVFLQPVTAPGGRPEIAPEMLEAQYQTARSRLRRVRVVPQMHRFLQIA